MEEHHRPPPVKHAAHDGHPIPAPKTVRAGILAHTTSGICRVCLSMGVLSTLLSLALHIGDHHLIRGFYDPKDVMVLIIVLMTIPLHILAAISTLAFGFVGVRRSLRAPTDLRRTGPLAMTTTGIMLALLTLASFAWYSGVIHF